MSNIRGSGVTYASLLWVLCQQEDLPVPTSVDKAMTQSERAAKVREGLNSLRDRQRVILTKKQAEAAVRAKCAGCEWVTNTAAYCEHPLAQDLWSDGELHNHSKTQEMRAEDGLCGPDALLFSPAPKFTWENVKTVLFVMMILSGLGTVFFFVGWALYAFARFLFT